MKNKILSVIIPAFNIEKYIKNAVMSLDNWIDNEFVEIIIVDDGSTDNTLDVAIELSLRYKNITTYTKLNDGLSNTRNFGKKKAKGEYILFFDGDDYFDKKYKNRILEILNSVEPSILCFGYRKVLADGSSLSNHLLRLNGEDKLIQLSKKAFIETIIDRKDEPIAGYMPTKIFKNSLVENIDFLKMNYEDLPFIFELLEKSPELRIFYLNKVLYNYVQRNDSITHTVSENNLMDKLLSVNLVEKSLSVIIKEKRILNLNTERTLIVLLWVASLNRQVKSGKVWLNLQVQFKKIFRWILNGNVINGYLFLKLIYYYVLSEGRKNGKEH